MRRHLLSLLLVVPLCLVGCGGSEEPTTPTTPSTPSPTGPADLTLTTLTDGTGTEATGSVFVVVHYTLWLYDPAGTDSKGTRIESSRDTGRSPYSFRMGISAVIPGFEQSISGMKVGGQRRAIVPPSLAYGSTGSAPYIQPNTWLVFEIELLAVTS